MKLNLTQQVFLNAKHELRMAWIRYVLRSRKIPSGLGQSGWALYGLVRAMRPDVCVEIGSAHGWSTCLVALALEQNLKGRLYAVDPHLPNDWSDPNPDQSLNALRENLNATGLAHRVEIVRKITCEAAPELPERVDFAFVDGDHSYEGVKTDWEILQPRLGPWSIVVFHDSLWEVHRGVSLYEEWRSEKMGVPAFLENLRKEGYPLVTIDADWGLTMVQGVKGSGAMVPLQRKDI
jgi:predicted O-methyltransferase YrrM